MFRTRTIEEIRDIANNGSLDYDIRIAATVELLRRGGYGSVSKANG